MEKVKTIFIMIFTTLSAWMGVLAIPVYLLISLNIVDWFTGYVAAPYRGQERQSRIGFKGIAKKVSMLMLVWVGCSVDWLMQYAVSTIGISISFNYVAASLVAVWLIANEIISILENIADMGIDLPPFLMKLAKWVKSEVETKTGGESDKKND